MQNQGTIQNLLQKTLASSVGASASQIHTAKASTKIPQAFKTIYDHKLHALPVQTDNGEEFVSFVDLADIASHLFSSFTDEELKHANLPQITEYKGEYIRVVGEKDNMWEPQEIPDPSKIQHFANKSVGLIAKTPYVAVSDKKTLLEVLDTMVSSKARRVALYGDIPKQLTKIVTQSDIIRFLDQQDLGNVANVTVKDLGLETKDVVKVKTTDVAIEGFKLMNNHNISGVAVVDEHDNFVGNLSLSDLRLIVANANELLHLYLNVGEYIKKSGKYKGISCTKETTLKELIHTFVTNKIQRIFVIDENNKVTGLVSMTDVINVIHSSKL